MSDIAGIPYVEAQFDKNGTLQSPVALPAGVTDLFVMSHGWNNSVDEARKLYRGLFTNFVAVARPRMHGRPSCARHRRLARAGVRRSRRCSCQ